MFQNVIEVLILSAIQGISEFLPISSSAHLILVSSLYEFKSSSLLIDISLHLGSLFAIIYFFRDELEGSVGYIFLAVMVFTSFRFGRKFVNPMQWKLVHKGGIYFLWSYPFSVYWWALATTEPRVIDYIFYWSGLFVFLLRIAAWGKKRQQVMKRKLPESSTPIPYKVLGSTFIIFGLFASATSYYWQKSITEFLTATAWSAELELWLPFWPLEPFLSLIITALGTLFLTKFNRERSTAPSDNK